MMKALPDGEADMAKFRDRGMEDLLTADERLAAGTLHFARVLEIMRLPPL